MLRVAAGGAWVSTGRSSFSAHRRRPEISCGFHGNAACRALLPWGRSLPRVSAPSPGLAWHQHGQVHSREPRLGHRCSSRLSPSVPTPQPCSVNAAWLVFKPPLRDSSQPRWGKELTRLQGQGALVSGREASRAVLPTVRVSGRPHIPQTDHAERGENLLGHSCIHGQTHPWDTMGHGCVTWFAPQSHMGSW